MYLLIVVFLVALVALLLIIASGKPDSFEVVRTAYIKAPPERVFALLNDFHQWPRWSPWEKLDPAMVRRHDGTASGEGAIYAWEGNKKVGAGRMEILDSLAHSQLTIQLDFLKPFEAHNTARFTLAAEAGGTRVTWQMNGAQPFAIKVMSVFADMDKMIGKDFEAGLANLGAVATQAD